MLSYGDDIIFNVSERVTQLVAPNGYGKSSIPTILEELLFNKNSRGVKKADIANWYTDKEGYSGFVEFSEGEDTYRLAKTVKSTAKVVLTKNGEDISGHTTTQTYKLIEQIMGMDFSTFTKLVYQSTTSSLDFLRATDANRKKFLVSLLGLTEYAEAEEALKEAFKAEKGELEKIQGAVNTISSWITNNGNVPPDLTELPVPELDPNIETILSDTVAQSKNINLHNQTAKENLANISAYEALIAKEVPETADNTVKLRDNEQKLSEAQREYTTLKAKVTMAEAEYQKVHAIKENCHVCGSSLGVHNKQDMLTSAAAVLEDLTIAFEDSSEVLAQISKIVNESKSEYQAFVRYNKYKTDVELAESRLDSTKPTQIEDVQKLNNTITSLQSEISITKKAILDATNHNAKVSSQNATFEYRRQELVKFKFQLEEEQAKLENAKLRAHRMEVLVKAMGNKGLISYKIESMVKVFEDLINQYLQVLSGGEFALTFSVEDSKLVLELYKSSRLVDIKSLSSGEFNKVNTATLLAVRKLMTAVSKVDINLLFLDEVISVLDVQARDTLVEVLLQEHNLNSIMVSHEYTHPLANTVNIYKDNDISRLGEDNA